MKNKIKLLAILIPIIVVFVFGAVPIGFKPDVAIAASNTSLSQNSINASLMAQINELIKLVQSLIAKLNLQMNTSASNTNTVSNSSANGANTTTVTNTTSTDNANTSTTIINTSNSSNTGGKIICPLVMCVAPPAGMCYVKDSATQCGCGTLTSSCGNTY